MSSYDSDDTQFLSRGWIWHPISPYGVVLYSSDVNQTTFCCAALYYLWCWWKWHAILFKNVDFGIPPHYMIHYFIDLATL